jgi:hypothetical protein
MHRRRNLVWMASLPAGGFSGKRLEGGRFPRHGCPISPRGGNRKVTLTVQTYRSPTEMTPVKAALLSFAMMSAIVLCGFGIYSASASAKHAAIDGYGVTASRY